MQHRPSVADLVVHNAVLLPPPGVEFGPEVSALAVSGGRIAAIGGDELMELVGPDAIVLDAGGGLLTPGLDDAHTHVLAGGAWMQRLQLSGATDLGELQRLIREYGAGTEGWVVGGGWSYPMIPGGLPTKEQLDAVVPDRPAFMVNADGHTSWVNSAALRLAGIDRYTPDPPDGEIHRDAAGEPTGALLERASRLIHRVMPERGTTDYESDLLSAMPALLAAGFTAVQDPRTYPYEVPGWTQVRDRGDLKLRSRLALMLEPGQSFADWYATLDDHEELLGGFRDADWIDGGILKCFVDGVVETGTAAMLEPYADGGTGRAAFEPDELTAFVVEADRRGWQVQAHAIGDRAVRMALDAFEAAAERNGPWSGRQIRPGSARVRRHRLEHIEVTGPDDVRRIAQLGVIASIQPLHACHDPGRVESWVELLGAERTAWTWPMAQILGAGGTIALGSDWPVVGYDPIGTLTAALTTSNYVGPAGPNAVTASKQVGPAGSNALTVRQALTAYTYGSAVAAYAEDRRGTLAVGKDADLTLFDRDLLSGEIAAAEVRATIVAGSICHLNETEGVR
ncbi:amidohydrolase [Kribbella sp. GL6]|uniref:amidohydrolase n=1 Tax=Kribbella sp. GL6 TaxID=3419765 RepID=UPI003CFDD75F